MSTAGGAAALTIDILTNMAGLGSGLAQAEAQVSQSATNMGKKVDNALGENMAQRIIGGLKKSLGAAAIADVIGNMAQRMNKEFGARIDFFEVMRGGLADTVSSIPLLGAPVTKLAGLFEKYGEEIGIRFAEGFLGGQSKGITSSPRFHAGTGVGVEDLPWYMQMFNPTTGYAIAAGGGNPITSPYGSGTARMPTPGVAIGPNEAMRGGLQDELAELLSREKIRMQVDTRSQMISQRLQMGYGQVDTAFGAMKFAAGGPAEASREIVQKADEQLRVQERIKIILETLGAQMNAGN
jgi:hypothetical protein